MDEHSRRSQADRLVRLRRTLLEAEMTGRGIDARRGRKSTDPATRAAFDALDTVRALAQREGRSSDDDEAEEAAATLLRGKARLKAAFYAVIGDPPTLDANDVNGARAYHKAILRALDMGGWTHSEQTALAHLERVWRARSRGEDARFRIVGNRPGRVTADVQARIRAARGRQP
jgi:hypothetical protein